VCADEQYFEHLSSAKQRVLFKLLDAYTPDTLSEFTTCLITAMVDLSKAGMYRVAWLAEWMRCDHADGEVICRALDSWIESGHPAAGCIRGVFAQCMYTDCDMDRIGVR
jgi:hypothetical protein